MNEQYCPRPRADGFLQSVEVDLPAMVVDQTKRAKLHVLNSGEKIEQRIAGLSDCNFVPGLAQQAETETNMPRSYRWSELTGQDQGAQRDFFAGNTQ